MNNLETFIQGVNPWWKNPSFRFEVKTREYYLKAIQKNTSKLIRILIGARRVGKTSIIRNLINEKLDKVSPSKVIYIPADLKEVRERGIRSTVELISANLNIDIFKEEAYFFIDEIQEVENWQEEIKVLYDNTSLYFFLTGSSSLLLKQETSKLTGRFILTTVLPLSFSEFIQFNKDSEKSEVELLEDYLKSGGYPEYVINKDPIYLQQSIESTLYRELLDSYGIRNPALLMKLLGFLADKITTPVSANRISIDLKIDDKTAKFYLEYLEAVYLIYPVYRYGLSHKISKSSVPKYYFNDTGILNMYSIRTRMGHLIKNAVFLKLLRNEVHSELPDIYYEVINNIEVDFRNRNELFEVKHFKEDLNQELERFNNLDQKIKVIIKDLKNFNQELAYYDNLKLIDLLEFLKD